MADDGNGTRLLGQAVEALLDDEGITEAEVARRIGSPAATITAWRRGTFRRLPCREHLAKFSELVGAGYLETLTAALYDIGYLAADEAAAVLAALDDAGDGDLTSSGMVNDGSPRLVKCDPTRGNLVDGTVLYYDPREDGAYVTVNGIDGRKYVLAFDSTDIEIIGQGVAQAVARFDTDLGADQQIRITPAGIDWMRGQPEISEAQSA